MSRFTVADVPGSFENERVLAEWLISTCLLFGAALETALAVAWHFVADPKIKARFHRAAADVEPEEPQK